MRLHLSLSVAALAVLGACSQTAPTQVIAPEPTFNKLGEGECPEGYTYVPGALFEGTCDPDDDPRNPPRSSRDPAREGTDL